MELNCVIDDCPETMTYAGVGKKPQRCSTHSSRRITSCIICHEPMHTNGAKGISCCRWCRGSTPEIDKAELGIIATAYTDCRKCGGLLERSTTIPSSCHQCKKTRPQSLDEYKKLRPCSICQGPVWFGKDSALVPCCQSCRQATPNDELRRLGILKPVNPLAGRYKRVCEECGTSWLATSKQRRFCSLKCSGKADSRRRRGMRNAVTSKSRRVDLAAQAAGLNTAERRHLLHKWKKQKRTCIYCDQLATTVEHVIPLVRGGTNHEGNLAPACTSCNSRKQDRLIIEHKLGRPPGYTWSPSWKTHIKRTSIPKKPKTTVQKLIDCPACGSSFTTSSTQNRYCSKHCQLEWNARAIRERHRASKGLEPTWHVPRKIRAA